MESNLDTRRLGPTERATVRRYYIHYFVPFALFALSLGAHAWAVQVHAPAPWPTIAALLPAVPATWMLVVVTVFVARGDEYQRRLTTEAASIAFAVMLFTALIIALLAQAEVAHVSAWAVFGLGLAAFGAARVRGKRR